MTKDGFVYGWGDRHFGMKGSSPAEEDIQPTPRQIQGLREAVQISACYKHSAAVTCDGNLYTWGNGGYGKLGHGNEESIGSPKIVHSLYGREEVSTVSCGFHHTAVTTTEGSLFSFGQDHNGQLGLDDETSDQQTEPQLVESLQGVFIASVSCGWGHTIARSREGQVYTWGMNAQGQLGHGSGVDDEETTPTLVEALKGHEVVRVDAFPYNTVVVAKRSGAGKEDSLSAAGAVRAMLHDSRFSDVTFLVEGEEIRAHRAMLSLRCEYFDNMFQGGMLESRSKAIPLPNVRKDIFLLVLKYLYTDVVLVDADQVIELYALADMYQLDRLKGICRESLQHGLNVENFARMLERAIQSGYNELKDGCLKFIVANFADVSDTDAMRSLDNNGLLQEIMRKVGASLKNGSKSS